MMVLKMRELGPDALSVIEPNLHLTIGIILLQYSDEYTVDLLSLFHLFSLQQRPLQIRLKLKLEEIPEETTKDCLWNRA